MGHVFLACPGDSQSVPGSHPQLVIYEPVMTGGLYRGAIFHWLADAQTHHCNFKKNKNCTVLSLSLSLSLRGFHLLPKMLVVSVM